MGETVAVAPAARPRVRQRGAPARRRFGSSLARTSGPGNAFSYPDWIVDELATVAGEGDALDALLATGNRPAALTLRPNRTVHGGAGSGAADGDSIAAELAGAGVTVERGRLVPEAVVVRGAGDPAALPAVAEGRATPQDQASQAVVEFVAAAPGERILDVAAAPGGKATGLAERVGDDGLVVAADLDAGRLRLVAERRRRLG